MKKSSRITGTLLIVSFLASLASAQPVRYSVSGVVVDSLLMEPMPGVYVTLGKNLGTQTDRDGRFLIGNLAPGRYMLQTMYFSEYGQQTIELDVDRNISDITVYLKQNEDIDRVVVTGTRTERRLADVPVLTTVIGSRDVVRSGATSVMESLQDNVPGIVVSENAMGNNLRIRGLNSRYILFMVDGEKLVSEGAGGNINFDQIDVRNIDRIEMINGAASALYGSDAVGAVINIITKDPVHPFEGGVEASWQNHNTWRTRLELGSNTEKVRTRVSGFRNSSDGYDREGGASASPYADYGANLKLGYRPAKTADLNITGRYYRHEVFNFAGSMNRSHTLRHNMALNGSGGWRTADGRNDLRLSVGYDKFFDYDVSDRDKSSRELDNTASALSARLIDTFRPSDRWELVGGVEYGMEEIYSATTLGSTPATKGNWDMSGFAQAEWEAVKNFDIIAGARYTHNGAFGGAFSPKLSLMYEIGGFKFRGGIGSAFRAPALKELYYDFDHQGMFWVYGNPDLKAENGLYSSLSAEYTWRLLNVSVSGYYNDITDKIDQYSVVNTVTGMSERHYRNISSATLRGVDVSLACTFFRQMTLKGTYSFCDAVDNATGLQLESNTRHSGTVSLTWNCRVMRSPFSLQIAGRMNSPILNQYVGTDVDTGAEVIVREQSKTYDIWKLTLVKPFRLGKHTLEATVKVDNIFDFRDAGFVNPGRTFLVGLRYGFR